MRFVQPFCQFKTPPPDRSCESSQHSKTGIWMRRTRMLSGVAGIKTAKTLRAPSQILHVENLRTGRKESNGKCRLERRRANVIEVRTSRKSAHALCESRPGFKSESPAAASQCLDVLGAFAVRFHSTRRITRPGPADQPIS